jgi:SAM-dependent methyltransferase
MTAKSKISNSNFTSPDFSCPCCGNRSYSLVNILWPQLIAEWKINKKEEAYINRQQGLSCDNCHSNLRSMTLARAMMDSYGFYTGTFVEFLAANKKMKLLELNEAGTLSHFFEGMPNRVLGNYPEVAIEGLPYKDNSFDMVIHSDTLEHVKRPVLGLSETLRVLRQGGFTCFTIPLILGRLSKKRTGPKSYHGTPGAIVYLVQTTKLTWFMASTS